MKLDINKRRLCIFIILSIAIILIFSMTTSPLYPRYYYDFAGNESASKLIIGNGWLQGLIPYKDLFGDCGPLIYAIELLGTQYVFVAQIILICLSLITIDKIINLFELKNTKQYICLGLFVFFYIVCMGTGNSSEELSMLFVLIGVYICFKAYIEEERINGLLLGLSLGLLMISHFIYMIPLLGMLIFLIVEKKINRKDCLNIIVGIIIPLMIFSIYFYINNALYDMLYASFYFKIKEYIFGIESITEFMKSLIKCLPIFGFIGLCILSKDKYKNMLLSIGIPSLIICLIGNGDWNHFMILSLLMPLEIIVFDVKNVYKIILAFISLCIFGYPARNLTIELVNGITQSYIDNVDEIQRFYDDLLSDCSVLTINVSPDFYLINNCTPEYRLFDYHWKYNKYDESLETEAENYIYESKADVMIYQTDSWVVDEVGEYYMAGFVYINESWAIFYKDVSE